MIAEIILIGIASSAIFKIIEVWGGRKVNKSEFELATRSAVEDALAILEAEYNGITPYIEKLFFSDEKLKETQKKALIEAVFNADTELKKDFIRDCKALDIKKITKDPPEDVAQRFLELIKESVAKKLPKDLKLIFSKFSEYFNNIENRLVTIQSYLQDFDFLTPAYFQKLNLDKDTSFYEGREPLWQAILKEEDFIRELQGEIEGRILENPDGAKFLPITGNPKSGKTTFMKRLAFDLTFRHKKEVLWLKEDSKGTLNSEHLIHLSKKIDRPLYVICDNILEKTLGWENLRAFIDRISQMGVSCFIIGSMQLGEWKEGTGIPEDVLMLRDDKKREPYEIENREAELKDLIKKVESAGLKGEMSIKEALKRTLSESWTKEGELFLNFIYFFTESRSFRDSVTSKIDELKAYNYSHYNVLVWVSTFYQFGIRVPKSLLKRIMDEGTLSGAEENLKARKYLLKDEKLNIFFIFNQQVAKWIYTGWYDEHDDRDLKKRLKSLFEIEDFEGLNKDELTTIYLLFYTLTERRLHKEIVREIFVDSGNQKKIKDTSDKLDAETMVFVIAAIFYNLNMFWESPYLFEKAVKKRETFPEAYNNWGAALSDLARIKGDEKLFDEAFVKYLTSGFQSILTGKLEETPFGSIFGIKEIDDRYKSIPYLFIISIHYIKFNEINEKGVVFLKDLKNYAEGSLLFLTETLLSKKSERQEIEEGDDLMDTAAKILINKILDKKR